MFGTICGFSRRVDACKSTQNGHKYQFTNMEQLVNRIFEYALELSPSKLVLFNRYVSKHAATGYSSFDQLVSDFEYLHGVAHSCARLLYDIPDDASDDTAVILARMKQKDTCSGIVACENGTDSIDDTLVGGESEADVIAEPLRPAEVRAEAATVDKELCEIVSVQFSQPEEYRGFTLSSISGIVKVDDLFKALPSTKADKSFCDFRCSPDLRLKDPDLEAWLNILNNEASNEFMWDKVAKNVQAGSDWLHRYLEPIFLKVLATLMELVATARSKAHSCAAARRLFDFLLRCRRVMEYLPKYHGTLQRSIAKALEFVRTEKLLFCLVYVFNNCRLLPHIRLFTKERNCAGRPGMDCTQQSI